MILDEAADIFANHGIKEGEEVDDFYGFEPWDVEDRDSDIIAYAETWGVELEEKGHPFQTGALTCDKYLTLQQGGNQIGKSYPCLVRTIIEMTGELPVAYRFDKGVDTKTPRRIDVLNIQRFGRRHKETGRLIDYDPNAYRDGTWDCGNIIGCGKYPKELIPPRGSKIWICTFKQALEEMWWPDFQKMIPRHLLDTTRGTLGFATNPRRIYFNGGVVSFITYEQGFDRTEAKKVHRIYLDEEPPDRRFYLGCILHAFNMSMMFTPIRGLSWSYKDIYLPAITGKDPNIAIFHATQFDCPWRSADDIKKTILLLKPWEVEARVYGKYAEQRGKPYYDREKINRWVKRWIPTGFLCRFLADQPWLEISDLMRIQVHTAPASIEEHDLEEDTWEVYEEPEKGVAYWLSADTAQGTAEGVDAEDVLDRNVAYMWRAPNAEGLEQERDDPVMVASIRSKMRTLPFSRVVAAACRYYNNAILGAETRGEAGSTFLASMLDYPFWFKMAVVNQQSRKTVKKFGFDTTKNHRQQAFDLIGDWIDNRMGTASEIPHLPLMKELAACVVGKGGNPTM
jgi:phage terminase large subunit-like protein